LYVPGRSQRFVAAQKDLLFSFYYWLFFFGINDVTHSDDV
jgi:hypothetical protein